MLILLVSPITALASPRDGARFGWEPDRARRREATLGAALAVGALASALGCAEPHEPNYLFRGEWIDIDGQGRSAEETCGGTFAYVDAYAGALAREFGVGGHLGDYRWYSQERFDAELPCDRDVGGCASTDRTVSTPHLPLEHELVHLADLVANGDFCPRPLAEGLAEYYGPSGHGVGGDGFQRVVEAFADPSVDDIGWRSYGPLGRFAAYLVGRFGLDAVFEVCRTSGRMVNADQLSAAFQAVLGATTAELLADFGPELEAECYQGRGYQSRVFACGVAEAAPDIGLVGDERIELRYEIDCANEQTIGPLGGRIWILERLDLDQDDNWWVWIEGEEVDGKKIDTSEVKLIVASCEPCGDVVVLPGGEFDIRSLDAGRYWFELNAPADFVGTVRVLIRR